MRRRDRMWLKVNGSHMFKVTRPVIICFESYPFCDLLHGNLATDAWNIFVAEPAVKCLRMC
jgi:hypothetical protein